MVPARPVITAVSLAGNNLAVTFDAMVGNEYSLEEAADLWSNTWSSVLTNLAATSGPMTMTETNAVNQPRRFYRINLFW